MKPILIHTDPTDVRGNIKAVPANLFDNPNGEEEEVNFFALLFLVWD